MSTYSDAFEVAPQHSLPRDEVVEKLERISTLEREYEKRKNVKDSPQYLRLQDRRRNIDKKYVTEMMARGEEAENTLADFAPDVLPGEVMAEECMPEVRDSVSCVLWLIWCALTVAAIALTIAIPSAPRVGMIFGCICFAICALTMSGDGIASLKLKKAQTRWDHQFDFDDSEETTSAFLEECEDFDAHYKECAAEVKTLCQKAMQDYADEVRPINAELSQFEANEHAWLSAAEVEMDAFDLLPANYRYLAGDIAAIVRDRRAHNLTDALNLAIRERNEQQFRSAQLEQQAEKNRILEQQALNEQRHQAEMRAIEQQRMENEQAANEKMVAAQQAQAREQKKQRELAEQAQSEARKAKREEEMRRQNRELAATKMRQAADKQTRDYWESEWKRNL